MPAMLIYSTFMLVESTFMLNTMLTAVTKLTTKKASNGHGSDSPSSDIELAGPASVDLEPANVTSSGRRSLLDVLKLEKQKT